MSRYARIENGVVVEIIDAQDALDLCFHPKIVKASRPCGHDVAVGWVWDGATFAPPPAPIVDLVAYAASLRWQREIAGILVDGVPIATDDRSKVMITGARVAALSNPAWSTLWYGSDGQIYPLDAAAMIAISDAVQAHVNSGFATFAVVKAKIDAGEITTVAEVDAAIAA